MRKKDGGRVLNELTQFILTILAQGIERIDSGREYLPSWLRVLNELTQEGILTILLICIRCKAVWNTHCDTTQSQPA